MLDYNLLVPYFQGKIRYAIILVLLFALLGVFFFIPPQHPFIIYFFVFGSSFFSFLFANIWLSKKDSFVFGSFVLMFLFLNTLVGYSNINTILLISFVLGIRFLIQ